MRLAAGSRLGPYEITSAIGAGGMGEVYRARDTQFDTTREETMAEATIDRLISAESRLTRSFIGAAATFLLSTVWTMSFARTTPSGSIDIGWLGSVLVLLQVGCYVWYAIAAGSAAKVLGESGWKYTVWILAAPIIGLVPIPVVSTIINASPLSIKFLLGGQLQTAIREASFADLHQGV